MSVAVVFACVAALQVVIAGNAGRAVAEEAADLCSADAQAVGLCLGFLTTDEEQDPVVAAVNGAIQAGNVAGAYEFYSGAGQHLDATQVALIAAAFVAAPVAEEALGGEVSSGTDTAENDIAPVPAVAAARGSSAPQASRGSCCAVYNTYWEWSGREINYGYCQQAPYGGVYCESLGHFYADVRSNVDYFPDVTWSHDFWHKSGHRATLNSVRVKMKRDIVDKPDPTVATYSCGSGRVPISCWQNRRGPGISGNYYYVELNADVTCSCGRPSVHLKVQTRRWYIPSAGYPYYPAYYNGG